jgi:hypothetical protein
MGHNPDISLEAVINWVGVGIAWSQPIINRKDRHVYLIGPLSRVVLMGCAILTDKASPMNMNDNLLYLGALIVNKLHLLKIKVQQEGTHKANHHMGGWIML